MITLARREPVTQMQKIRGERSNFTGQWRYPPGGTPGRDGEKKSPATLRVARFKIMKRLPVAGRPALRQRDTVRAGGHLSPILHHDDSGEGCGSRACAPSTERTSIPNESSQQNRLTRHSEYETLWRLLMAGSPYLRKRTREVAFRGYFFSRLVCQDVGLFPGLLWH